MSALGQQISNDDLRNRFTYHPPKPGQPEIFQHLRDEAHRFAQSVVASCPPSRETSLAVTQIEDAVYWANAAIARHG